MQDNQLPAWSAPLVEALKFNPDLVSDALGYMIDHADDEARPRLLTIRGVLDRVRRPRNAESVRYYLSDIYDLITVDDAAAMFPIQERETLIRSVVAYSISAIATEAQRLADLEYDIESYVFTLPS